MNGLAEQLLARPRPEEYRQVFEEVFPPTELAREPARQPIPIYNIPPVPVTPPFEAPTPRPGYWEIVGSALLGIIPEVALWAAILPVARHALRVAGITRALRPVTITPYQIRRGMVPLPAERLVWGGRLALPFVGRPARALEFALTGATYGAVRQIPGIIWGEPRAWEEALREPVVHAAWDVTFPWWGPAARALGRGALAAPRYVVGAPLRYAVGRPIAAVARRVGRVPILPEFIARRVGGRTLTQLFIPGTQRVDIPERTAAEKFIANTSIMRQAASQAARRMLEIEPEARSHVRDLLKQGIVTTRRGKLPPEYMRAPLDIKEQVTYALDPIEQFVQTANRGVSRNTAQLRTLTFQKEVEKLFKKKLLAPEVFGPDYAKALRPLLEGKELTPKQIQEGLAKVIEHPETPEEAVRFAKDLYNLSADSLESFVKAAVRSEEAVLLKRFKELGTVSATQKPGYILSKHSKLKGLYIHPDAEDALYTLELIPMYGNRIHSLYNRLILTPWKLGKVVLRLATQMRNLLSNMILNSWGGLWPWRGDIYLKAARELRRPTQIARQFTQDTGYSTTFAEVETRHLPRFLRYDKTGLDVFEYYLQRVTAIPTRAYQMVETWAKLAKYIYNLEKKMPRAEAARDAVRWTFNYGETTPFVRGLATTLIPFARWQSKVIPLFFETLERHPERLVPWALLLPAMTAYSLKATGVSSYEWQRIKEMLPEWQREGLVALVPFRDANNNLMLYDFTWFLPGFGDLAELRQAGVFHRVFQNPFITYAADVLRNRTFSGAPIVYEWEPLDVKAAKYLSHAWIHWMPSMVGLDVRSILRVIERPELTAGMFIAQQLGHRVYPLDPYTLRRGYYFRLQQRRREIGRELRRRLRYVTDPAERQRLVEEYLGYLE